MPFQRGNTINVGRRHTSEWKIAHSMKMSASGNSNYNKHGSEASGWRGGRIVKNGYVFVYSPNHPNQNSLGYVREHILVMEKYLNRFLTKDEVVHHINKNRLDNRIENLRLMSRSEHTTLHLYERYKKGVI